jgi:hypothetical protein
VFAGLNLRFEEKSRMELLKWPKVLRDGLERLEWRGVLTENIEMAGGFAGFEREEREGREGSVTDDPPE